MNPKLLRVAPSHTIDDLVVEIRARGGRALQLFPPSYVIAELPDAAKLASGERFDPADPAALDAQGRTAALVLRRLTERKVEAAPAARVSWDVKGKKPPGLLRETPLPLTAPRAPGMGIIARSTGTPTSRYLIGRVAVALVIVSRERGGAPNPNAEFLSATERDTAAVEAAEGLAWLANAERRAMVDFAIERHDLELTTAPNPAAPNTFDGLEAVWRDPALAALGYPAGRDGYARLARDVRDRNGAQWGYVLFVTRYPLFHFAYSAVERVVQHYDNDGWGVTELNRVIAHETCHVFGALDEYAASNCNCTDKAGELQVANSNCVRCATRFVPCLMEANTLEFCDATRGQLGWRAPLLRWNFMLQTGTALHETGDDFEFFFVDWDRDGKPDLMAVKKSGTGTHSTEVHIFSGASNFRQPILQTGTALHETDATFQFCVTDWDRDGRPDLVAIKKSNTGTGSTEVHVLSGASRFQRFILQTGTGLHPTDHTFAFGMAHWNFGGAARPDLFAIKKSGTGTGSTEVHVFSGESNFQQPLLQTGTRLHETNEDFDFLVVPFTRGALPDLVAIKKRNTGTLSTEIHVLSGATRFQTFIEQSGSALHETDASFAFASLQLDLSNPAVEIAAIKKRNTGTHSTEVHILRQ